MTPPSEDIPGPGAPLVVVVDEALDDCVLLAVTLRREGFEVLITHTLAEGQRLLRAFDVAVVIFEVHLPDGNGLDLCRTADTGSEDPPFLIALSGDADEPRRLLGFEAGVDDFVAKPFSPQEVAFRVSAMLRRRRQALPAAASRTIRIGDLEIDQHAHEVRVAGRVVTLTRVEYDLLRVLAVQPNVVLTHQALIDSVWEANWPGDSHNLRVHVSNVRRKLGGGTACDTFIRAIRGVGYRLGPCRVEAGSDGRRASR